ncbi:hypothetical protein BCR44DRAFT_1434313 [Catenaria anguillulae PL171]|uniref:Uncharacterized protein n=1 Tax=Catenaria anguillulae PL171 TaxID=765915 RepID=A0A1Y2HNU5_9FUNG|nr:hypothetical protein BCR44DRAFT_1434313 [Catenaria anguillulae PL171]
MHSPNANLPCHVPPKQTRSAGRDTKRPFDHVSAGTIGILVPFRPIKQDPDASVLQQQAAIGLPNQHPSQGRRKRQRLQADPDQWGSKYADLASTQALTEALQRFIAEYACIEQVLASGPPSVAELLQQPLQAREGIGIHRPLFPTRVVTQVDARTITAFACTSLFGTMKKADRTAAMASLDACLDSLVDQHDLPIGNQRVERSTSNPDLLHVSALIPFSRSRIDAVSNSQVLADWAQTLVSKDKSRRLDKLIRTAILAPAVNATNGVAELSPWSPLDRVFALKLALENLQSANLVTIDKNSTTYNFTPVSPISDPTTDPLATLDSSATIPWIPAAHLPLPIDVLTNPQLADFVLSKLMAHFRSTPRGQSNPSNPALSLHETLRVLDKNLTRLFPYVPTRCIAARAILQHLASQQRIHLTTQVLLQPPPPDTNTVPPPLTPKSTITNLCPTMLAIPSCTDTGTRRMQSLTRAVWQTLEARHARTLPAMIHQLVYFHPEVPMAANETESERWVVAEFAVWRAWSELKVVGIKVVEDKAAGEASRVEAGLEEVQAQIASSVFGVGGFDPRKLMLVELVNGAAPGKGPAKRKGKDVV